jgi:hypothetical protein
LRRSQGVAVIPSLKNGSATAKPTGATNSGGAPRPMKMGTIASLWRYDATVEDAPPQDDVRRPAILRYAQWATIFCASWTIQ